MSKNTWWNILKNTFKVLVTVGAIYLLSTKISWLRLRESLLNANFTFLALAFLSYVASQVIASSRLFSFFKATGIRLTERYNLRLYQLGLLYNYFIPGGIGGDAYKIYLLKKRFNYRGRKVLTAIFFDRLSGFWALSIIVGTLILFMPRLAIPNIFTIVAMLAGTVTYYYLLRLFFPTLVQSFFTTHFKALLVQGFQALSAILIMYAINFEGKFSPYVFTFMISSIVALVPSIFGALGVRESAVSILSEYLQIDEHLSVLITLLFNFISIIVASSGLYYILRPRGLGADKLPSAKEVEKVLEEESKKEEE